MFKKYWIVGLFVLGLLIFLYPHIAQQHTKRAQMNEVVKIKDEFKHVSEKEKEKKKEGVHSCNEAIFMNEDGINDPFTFSYDRDHYEQRSEELTSELQSRGHLVCRLLLEKKKK